VIPPHTHTHIVRLPATEGLQNVCVCGVGSQINKNPEGKYLRTSLLHLQLWVRVGHTYGSWSTEFFGGKLIR
jgi:hypothetical protein